MVGGTEMTKEEIKNNIAQSVGYADWTTYYNWIARDEERPDVVAQLIETAMEKVVEEYSKQEALNFALFKEEMTHGPLTPFGVEVIKDIFETYWKERNK
jgi:hypothetical protein